VTDLARLVVALEAQTAKYQEGLDAATRKLAKFSRDQNTMLGSIDKRFRGFTSGIRNTLGLIGVGFSFAKIIEETVQAEREFAQLDAVLRSTGQTAGWNRDQLTKMASDFAAATTASEGEIIQAQTRLLQYTNVVGERFPEAIQAALDMSARFGTSVAESAAAIGKALQNPEKGITQLTKAGVAFTEQEKKLVSQLMDSGRVMDAQKVVLQGLERAYGGAAEAARNTLGGALQALRNTFHDLLTGETGVTGATDAINTLTDTLNSPDVKRGFDLMIAGFAKMIELSAKAAAGVAGFARSFGESMAQIVHGPLPADALDLDEATKKLREWEGMRDRIVAGYDDMSAAAQAVAKVRLKELNEEIDALKRRQEFLQALPERPAAGATGMRPGTTIRTPTAPYDPKKDPALQDVLVTAEKIYVSPMEQYYRRLDELSQTSTEKQLARFAELESALDELYQQGLISPETYNQRWQEAFDQLIPKVEVTAKKIGDQLKAQANELSEFWKQASRNVQDFLGNTIVDVMNGSFDDILGGFERMLQNMVAQALAADINSKLFGSGGVGSGNGWISKGLDWLGGMFGGSRDSGGRGRKGQVYKIGVGAQPEYFAPDEAGTFYPRGQGMGSGAGGVTSVHQNIYVQGRVDERTARQLELDAARRQRAAMRLA
jgi:hypothetical protein